eukprot:NODE_688_length_1250_cov_1758.960866_g550_i0.p2 GENE.NODE_688_length_1250_cov_1758.960866_g550_i0~~NODE_688_length_1250_cov_1758.960866_g550_i0.p2  ORF type:complete len:341 (+),score=101.19 NODE_688_length_1250_cov_1758.960866_g550_i0:69-1091(+)
MRCLAVFALAAVALAASTDDDIFGELQSTSTAFTCAYNYGVSSAWACPTIGAKYCTASGCSASCSATNACKDPSTPFCNAANVCAATQRGTGLSDCFAAITGNGFVGTSPCGSVKPSRMSALQGGSNGTMYNITCQPTASCETCLIDMICRRGPYSVIPVGSNIDQSLYDGFGCVENGATFVRPNLAWVQAQCNPKGSPKGLLGLLGLLGLIPLLLCLLCLCCLLLRRKKREGDVHFATFDAQSAPAALIPAPMPVPMAAPLPCTTIAPATACVAPCAAPIATPCAGPVFEPCAAATTFEAAPYCAAGPTSFGEPAFGSPVVGDAFGGACVGNTGYAPQL